MGKILFAIFLVISLNARAFDFDKTHISVDYNYTLGLSERTGGQTFTRGDVGMHGNAVSVSVLYDINRMFSVGVGIAACAYEPIPSALPIFATLRYRPFVSKSAKDLYVFTSAGYGIPVDDDDTLSSGFMANIGFGWQKMFRTHFGINVQLGYSFHQFKTNTTYVWGDDYESWHQSKSSTGRNSLMLGFGIVF